MSPVLQKHPTNAVVCCVRCVSAGLEKGVRQRAVAVGASAGGGEGRPGNAAHLGGGENAVESKAPGELLHLPRTQLRQFWHSCVTSRTDAAHGVTRRPTSFWEHRGPAQLCNRS
eukprot:504828-Rhodomonas_salina.1